MTAHRWGLVLVLIATALLYTPTLSADFVTLDDYAYVKANRDVQEPRLATILDPRHLTASDWTPVVTLSHALEYTFGGLNPHVYHLTNLVLHLACVALVYCLLCDLEIPPYAALLASLVFAIHPLQVESVAWIAARKNLLSALFGLLYCRAFLSGRFPLAILALLFALGSKGTAVMFPLWVGAALVARRDTIDWRRSLPWLAVACLLGLGRAALSASVQSPVMAGRPVGSMSFSGRMSITGPVLAVQIRQFFFPHDLSAIYRWAPAPWSDTGVWMAWLAVVLAGVGVAWMARRQPLVALAGCLTVLGLLPTLNLLPAPDFQADRYVYMALAGAGVLAVVIIGPLRHIHRLLPSAVLFLWCVAIGIPMARARIAVWRNSETLWHDVLQRYPDFVFGWDSLARYYLERDELDSAQPVLRRVLTLDPTQVDARLNLALLYANRQAPDDAKAEYVILLSQHPELVSGRVQFAELLAHLGDTAAALEQANAALEREPANVRARFLRARVLLQAGRLDDAAADFEQLLRTQPAAPLLSGFAAVRSRQGRGAEAIDLSRQATERNPHHVDGWDILSEALAAAGELDAAADVAQRGVAANPESAVLWRRLAAIHTQRGDAADAIAAASRAAELERPGT